MEKEKQEEKSEANWKENARTHARREGRGAPRGDARVPPPDGHEDQCGKDSRPPDGSHATTPPAEQMRKQLSV